MDAGAAAFVIALGFGDRIVGTAAPDFKDDFDGGVRKELDAIPVLDPGSGAAEAVIAAQPQLVTGVSQHEFGGFDGTASVEQLQDVGAVALSACGAIQDEPTSDLDETYRYIAALADTFDVPKRGDALIKTIQHEVSVAASAQDSDGVPVLTLSSVPVAGVGLRTTGGSSFANGVLTLAGGQNVAESQLQDFANLSVEQVAVASPEVIVVVSGFSAEDDDELTSAIISSPLLENTPAAQTGNVVVVPQRVLLSPSVLNADAVKVVADAVATAS